jgi:MFS family permease
MFTRLKTLRGAYPTQFWLMFFGMIISTIGSSMVWPFLMMFATGQIGLSKTAAGSLLTINSAVSMAAAFLAGPVIDRLGRKWIMAVSLLGISGVYIFYTQADSYLFVAVLMALTGFFNPLYRVGADAMMADLIPSPQRPEGYALLRMANNLGIAIGPAIGGMLAVTSYDISFLGAAAGMGLYGLVIAFFARETLPPRALLHSEAADGAVDGDDHSGAATPTQKERLGGYLTVLRDRPFLSFIIAFTITQFCAALIWVMLGVHAQDNYGLREDQYGLIPITNAVMVVGLQAVVTRQTRRHAPLPVLAVGSFFYAAAVTSVAFGAGFWGFWLSMIIMTTGELMLMPTSTTYTADLAPAHMRGRYMSVYSLTWGIAQGIAPLAGGLLADQVSPSAPWLAGGAAGMLAVLAFVVLARRTARREKENTLATGD